MKKLTPLILLLLAACHKQENVEVVYKNSNSSNYQYSHYNIFDFVEQSPNGTKRIAVQEIKQEPNTQISSNKYHVVKQGETFYSIARTCGINPHTLMAYNGYNDGDILKIGTAVKLEEGTIVKTTHSTGQNLTIKRAEPAVAANASSNIKSQNLTTQIARPESVQNSSVKVVSPASNGATKPVQKTQAKPTLASSGMECGSIFAPPVKNLQVLQGFGTTSASGVKADGIIYKILQDVEILASANGEVVYKGEGFADYGKIIIVRHAENYFSIYGHLENITTNKGDAVVKGKPIATGSASEGKFYFSIRRAKTPINPQNCY